MNFIVVGMEKNYESKRRHSINRQKYIRKYFSSYPKKVKYQVEFFVSDMYDTYINLSKKQFPNAKIVMCRFHTKRLIVNFKKEKNSYDEKIL